MPDSAAHRLVRRCGAASRRRVDFYPHDRRRSACQRERVRVRATQHDVSMEEEVRRLFTEQPWMTRRPRIPHTWIGSERSCFATGRLLRPSRMASSTCSGDPAGLPGVPPHIGPGAMAQFPANSLLRGGCYATHLQELSLKQRIRRRERTLPCSFAPGFPVDSRVSGKSQRRVRSRLLAPPE